MWQPMVRLTSRHVDEDEEQQETPMRDVQQATGCTQRRDERTDDVRDDRQQQSWNGVSPRWREGERVRVMTRTE